MEYDSSAEESYFALPMQMGDINIYFEPSIEEVRMAMLDKAYNAKISSWQNMLSCYIDLASPPTKKESKVIPVEDVPTANKGIVLATLSSQRAGRYPQSKK